MFVIVTICDNGPNIFSHSKSITMEQTTTYTSSTALCMRPKSKSTPGKPSITATITRPFFPTISAPANAATQLHAANGTIARQC
jgi:hypothetical protein